MKLELKGITKKFGSLVANDHIDLTIEPGEIHALLGENGAGKSTLMNILYGMYQPDEGEILIDDQPVHFTGPGEAVGAGIGMVHQHFMLVPVFTVAESVALGYEPIKAFGVIDASQAAEHVRTISAQFGFNVDPDALIADLPVGVQQRVEIIKALSHDARILILDEPTAVLTPQETDDLIKIMHDLRDSGTSIVFITHKLREVRAVADKITVIRRGQVVGQAAPTSSEAELASLMVGRDVALTVEKGPASLGSTALNINNLSAINSAGRVVLEDISFDIKHGEILAVAGVQGNGQTELARCVLGLDRPRSGTITLSDSDLTERSVREHLLHGMGFVPEDRSADGIIADFSIAENLILDNSDSPEFGKGIYLDPSKVRNNADRRVKEYDIRITAVEDHISTLSGGNQQKVVLAREMSRDLDLLVASQPTRGLDVGSIEFVHQRIIDERDGGAAVLLISSELDEVYSLADRIAVMYRGRIVAVVSPEVSRDELGLLMAGVTPDQDLQLDGEKLALTAENSCCDPQSNDGPDQGGHR